MERPRGTITFLFTDVEGSTRRWEADPDTMRTALEQHDQLLGSVITAHDGWLFKHTGDGVCAAFSSATAAVDAAVAAQRQLDLPVRMGLATGTADLRGDDYFGPVLNRAARVMTVAHGRQILMADSTASLLEAGRAQSVGIYRLRDLPGVHDLHQAVDDDLPQQFPPPRAERASVGNIPASDTTMYGRDAAVAEIVALIESRRLVTLTGVGGVGKTRLALAAATTVGGTFAGGAWWVELAAATDDTALVEATATALGVTPRAGMSTQEAIAASLAARPSLLVLDNCEHLLDATAALIESLMARAPDLHVLTTSREGLGVPGEHLWVVPSLGCGHRSAPAVELFVDRAGAVGAAIDLDDDEEMAAVVEICERLDGIALGIELAAARATVMSPQELRARLDDRFRLLTGSRRRMERHQTLRQAVQWSFDLLSPIEQTTLARCSVFAGGFDLGSVTAVCADDGTDEFAMAELLGSLAAKSLLRVDRVDGRSRFSLLETIRQFGQGRLGEMGEVVECHQRHAAWFVGRVREAWEDWNSPGQASAVARLLEEAANLRQAVEWSLRDGALSDAVTIAAHTAIAGWGIQWFEPAGWAADVMLQPGVETVAEYPRLLSAVGLISCYTGKPAEALELTRKAQEFLREDGFDPFDGLGEAFEATAHIVLGNPDGWIEVCERLHRRSGEARVIGQAGLLWGLPAVGRSAEARALSAEANRAAADWGQPWWTAMALLGTGRAFADHDPGMARAALAEGIEVAGRHGLTMWMGMLARELAGLEASLGDVAEALARMDHALYAFGSGDDIANHFLNMATVGVLLHRVGRDAEAMVAFGSTGAMPLLSAVLGATEALDAARDALGDAAADHHADDGQSMDARRQVEWSRAVIADLLAVASQPAQTSEDS